MNRRTYPAKRSRLATTAEVLLVTVNDAEETITVAPMLCSLCNEPLQANTRIVDTDAGRVHARCAAQAEADS